MCSDSQSCCPRAGIQIQVYLRGSQPMILPLRAQLAMSGDTLVTTQGWSVCATGIQWLEDKNCY